MLFDIKQSVLAAENRIRSFIRETPLDYSLFFSELTGSNVYLKCENLQYTNAFKVRGAFNKLLSLTPAQRAQGVVTASSGNHGAAVAFGLHQLKLQGKVFVPENASTTKIAAIRCYGVPVEFYATDSMLTENYARSYAEQHHQIYISPYNDPEVISGQGTIAIELMRQLKKIDVVFVPIGGGGLISGIAGYLKSCSSQTQVIGCLPAHSPVMAESIKAGHIVNMTTQSTISDATAGGIEENAITFDFCQKFVDDYIVVTEAEIKTAMINMMENHHLLIEGAAGVALAACLKNSKRFQGKNVIIILSGGNISMKDLSSILCA